MSTQYLFKRGKVYLTVILKATLRIIYTFDAIIVDRFANFNNSNLDHSKIYK